MRSAQDTPANPDHGSARGGPTDPSHDARLRRGIIDTSVSRSVAAGLTLWFVLLIVAIPILQAVLEWRADEPSSLAALFQRPPDRDNLREFERDLEQASYFKSYAQPRIQLLLSRFGGVGNKRVVLGKRGFLYYTPGLMHVAGPSFIDADVIATRQLQARQEDGSAQLHADPRPAIFAFHDMLARRGITLVLFPVPDKTMLQPMQLHGRGDSRRAMQVARNPGWNAFTDAMRARGVKLFDPTPRTLKPSEAARFLVQDTHWTPQWMRQVAQALARFVREQGVSPAASTARAWHAVAQRVERVGDLVDMLKLPEDQALFRAQAITTYQVRDAGGDAWQPNPKADVLLLGDSFTNVFSLDSMEWGEGAGLAPQLALALGRDVDVIAHNDSGAFATRQALFRALQNGDDRLAGKRVVIWELAARELSVGDFKPFAWDAVAAHGSR